MARVQAAVDAAFDPAAMTGAFVVTYKGRIIAERYGENITPTTALESWSMGKSLSGTLMGILIKQGVYTLDQPAPIPEWQTAGDPRQKIRIRDILNMSSGLRIIAPQDPDYDESGPYPDHLYYYTGSIDSFKYAATRPQQWPPATVGRYRNTDPVLTNYMVRMAVEKRGEDYHSWPQRSLFDKLGIRTFVLDTDPYGNFLTHGYESASGRDWARIANLYLQDGVWNGERILPEGYAKFVGTLAPAWVADNRPQYGGLFWVNGDGAWPAPKDMYFMSGVGGQQVMIIPSHQLAVVRLGHYKGVQAAGRATRRAVLGADYVQNALDKATPFNAPLQELVTKNAWGNTWQRQGIDIKTRSIVTVSMLVALGRMHELKIHVRGALNNGVTPEELQEIFLHASVYCGFPAAVDAFRTASEVIDAK